MLELLCGTAGVSAALKRLYQIDCVAVDKIMPKAPKASITPLDLTVPENQQLVLSWIRMPQVRAVLLEPPCGTASAARSIPMPDEIDPPKPLRSLLQPDGLDNLQGQDLIRVSAANVLYDFSAQVWDLCCELNKPCLTENPKNSLFWFVSSWVERKFAHSGISQLHQACAYGSSRPKWTCLNANFEQVTQINLTCPGDHTHEAWGLQKRGRKRVFATALEVHYPSGLCDAIAHAIVARLVQQGFQPPAVPPSNKHAQMFSGVQAPASKVPPLVPEFKSRFACVFCNDEPCWPQPLPPTASFKLLHTEESWCGLDESTAKFADRLTKVCIRLGVDANIALSDNFKPPLVCCLKVYGIPWTPDEFITKANEIVRPLAPELALPGVLLETIDANCRLSAASIASLRSSFFAKWTSKAKDLSAEEQQLKQSMDPSVARAVRGKRICLFQQMLEEAKYPDPGVCDELINGCDLVGEVPLTKMLPGKFVPALCSESMLQTKAALLRPKLGTSCTSSGDPGLDEEVWRKTMEEVQKEWLRGPLDSSEVPHVAAVSRRFGLSQKKGKVRLIDDFSESGINACVSACESPVLHTIDVACSLFAMWFDQCNKLSLDPSLLIRTFDLTSAYRQIGLSKKGRDHAFIKVFNPMGKTTSLFQALVLPFGAVMSVHCFLRLSRALWWLGAKSLKLLWTSFYDDFICAAQPQLAKSSELAVTLLFKLTGWLFAEEGDKCMPFSNSCSALGVHFNLEDSKAFCALVSNTASRVDELVADLEEILQRGTLGSKDAQRIRGRMQFAESQMYGRTGKRCLRTLNEFAECRKFRLSPKDSFFLRLFQSLLRNSPPREVRCGLKGNVLVFSDACYERDSRDLVCGLGGVIFVPGLPVQFFSLALDSAAREVLGESSKKQIIFEAETLAALIACLVWSDLMDNKRCFVFVDNEGSKFALLRGAAENAVVDHLAELFVSWEANSNAATWISRVASASNIADEPSRGQHNHPLLKAAVNVSDLAEAKLHVALQSLVKWGKG